MLELVHNVAVSSVELDGGSDHPDMRTSGSASSALWLDDLGGLLLRPSSGSSSGTLYLVKLDGRAIRLSTRQFVGIGWDAPKARAMVAMSINYQTRARRVLMPALAAASDLIANAALGQPTWASLADRMLLYTGGHVRHALPGDGSTTSDAIIPDSVSASGTMAPDVLNGRWWVMDSGSGWCNLYDAAAKSVLRRVKVLVGWGAIGYSRKHDFFALLDVSAVPYHLKVYANDEQADHVTTPTFTPSPKKGAYSKLSAQVLGADNAPCVGRRVLFTVTIGSLDQATATTDDTGTATVDYRAPLNTASGQTATAELTE